MTAKGDCQRLMAKVTGLRPRAAGYEAPYFLKGTKI